jgi:hypothetical protein
MPPNDSTQAAALPEVVAAITDYAEVKTSMYFRSTEVTGEDGKPVMVQAVNTKGEPKADKDGNPVMEKKKEKRPNFEANVKLITLHGIIQYINKGDPKVLELIVDSVREPQLTQLRSMINAHIEANPAIDSLNDFVLDEDKLGLEYLSTLDKATRTGGGIAKEIWEAFAKDYEETMVALGSEVEKVKLAAKFLGAKFQPVKSNKVALAKLRNLLGTWFQNTSAKEEFQACFEFLDKKAEELLNVNEADLADNLG